jgi:linoleoyl-CoA desaturase
MEVKKQMRFINKDQSLFFDTLKERVNEYFTTNGISRHANSTMVVKTIVLLSGYLIPFAVVLIVKPSLPVSLILWTIMGFCLAGIGMSIMHDANHGAYSTSQRVNYWMGHTLNLVGGSVFNWKLQHNLLHHTYTNVVGMDEDIADKLALRMSPHNEVKPIHKFQCYYAFFLYSLLTIYWVVAKDFFQFARYTANGVNKECAKKSRIILLKIAVSKIVYIIAMLVIPALVFGVPFLHLLAGFVLMHMIAGFVLTIVFQLAHTVEGTTHPLPAACGNIQNSWAVHQMNTTVNFSRNDPFITWYVGGLNYQVEHHLFPKVCHVHYPAISDIVRQTAAEYNVPYLENKTFLQAVRSHISTLQRFGWQNLDEAIG